MSALKPKGEKIKLGNNEYCLRFTLNAIDDIQEHFNIGISELDKLFDDERNRIKNLRYLLTVLINEDIDCENDETGEKRSHVDERYVGRQIHAGNMAAIMNSVYKAFSVQSTDPDIDPPNPQGEQRTN
jgi:hypothetical protein